MGLAASGSLRGLLGSRGAYLGLLIGAALFAAVILGQGVGEVATAFGHAGWGVLALALLHLPPLWADALGWRSLLPRGARPGVGVFVRGRWIGESINELLPVLQMGGNVVKAWVLAGRGVPVGLAGASVVVDVSLVVLTQIVFTFVGLCLLAPQVGTGARLIVLGGAAILALLLAGFLVAQRRGLFGFVVQVSKRFLGASGTGAAEEGAAAIDAEVLRLHRERKALATSAAWHALSWVLGVGEVWAGLRLLGRPVDLPTALLFGSLGQAIRTGAFAVPGGLGVQEGGYVLVGSVLGIEAPISLALSLARRVREVLLGVPGLAVWQASALRKIVRRKRGFRVRRSPVIGVLNAGGKLAHWVGLDGHRLDAGELIRAARRETGLEALGDPPVEEPLGRLIESIESESRLHPLGRKATRFDLIHLLANRLSMMEDRRRHPPIAAVEVRRPIFITGLPRTGTTLLHNLLALDPAHRVPLTWEAMHPSPPPEADARAVDPRVRNTEKEIRWFHRMVKGFNRIHPVGALLPEECLVITGHTFLSHRFETTHRLPSYLEWLDAADWRPIYEHHRRFLQHLGWRSPGERWVLKAPAHLCHLEALFHAYPDACLVMTHRDPLEVAASNASLTAHLRGAFSDEVDPLEVGVECSRRWADAVLRGMRFRDGGSAPAGQVLDILYRDLVADPHRAVRQVYERFGIPFPPGLEDRMRAYLGRNGKGSHGKHRYTLEQFGLDRREEEERYAAYRERFGV